MNPIETIRVTYVEDEAYFLESFEMMPPIAERKSFKPTHVILTMGVVGAVVVGFLARHDRQKGDVLWWVPLVIFPSILLFLWISSFSPSAQRRAVRKELKKHVQTPPAQAWLEFGDSGFLSAGHGGRSSHFPWKTVPKVVMREEGFHIFTDHTTAYWVPVRAFTTTDDFIRLKDLLVKRVREFKHSGA